MSGALFFFLLLMVLFGATGDDIGSGNMEGEAYTGVYTEAVPMFSEIKGTGNIPDEIAQLAVGTAVKYRLLPSVILSQWAYESMWGRSQSAQNDTNFFGITWFDGCPFPKGSSRGIGGSEGGWYMKFPNKMASFSYYGHMVASQSNFNACVGNKNPGECLLILGRGGYAAAGITIGSPYYINCMDIINKNNLTQYDEFAIQKWGTLGETGVPLPAGKGDLSILEAVVGKHINNGECYGLTAYYVQKLGGPQMMGSGFLYAEKIGTDYNWEKYGWKAVVDPKLSDIQSGDVINWYGGGNVFRGPYGHTGIVIKVEGDQIYTYEQNAGQGRICAKYVRAYNLSKISSIVRKIK